MVVSGDGSSLAATSSGQAVDLETQVRQNVVIDDVIEKHGFGIESVLCQDYAVIECFVVLTDGSAPFVRTKHNCMPTGRPWL